MGSNKVLDPPRQCPDLNAIKNRWSKLKIMVMARRALHS